MVLLDVPGRCVIDPLPARRPGTPRPVARGHRPARTDADGDAATRALAIAGGASLGPVRRAVRRLLELPGAASPGVRLDGTRNPVVSEPSTRRPGGIWNPAGPTVAAAGHLYVVSANGPSTSNGTDNSRGGTCWPCAYGVSLRAAIGRAPFGPSEDARFIPGDCDHSRCSLSHCPWRFGQRNKQGLQTFAR